MKLFHLNENVHYTNKMLLNTYRMVQHTEPKLNGITEIYVLKMHLCVERLLGEILQKSPNESKKTLRSNFAAKRDEVEKLFDSDVYGGLFSKVYTLNKIRNEIAHNLESKKYQLLLQKLDDRIEVQSGYELTGNSMLILKKQLSDLYALLLALKESM
ncbi:hypothetical protein [Photobacterium kishitanii]|uniref:hypothetical protein n=1 Tax=Photobacterium kishitanii TaxID=318456 RepID=UPI0007F8A2D4|nr:hypothetical protein [Photobacterium kishitanii]OBU30196.1 hypothetical protein AYY23_21715 [Photobacterium kishitanii]PSW46832.1 hypothetical protein C0W66_21525 [Photobacterium kishitanii]